MRKMWLPEVLLVLAMAACTPIKTVETAQVSPIVVNSSLWEVIPGGETDSPEFYYQGSDYAGEDCLQVTVEAQQLPSELEIYIQSGDQRFAIDVVPWLEQGVKTVEVPLIQLARKDPEYGQLDPNQLYTDQPIDYAGIRAYDTSRRFQFRVTEFVFKFCAD